VRYELLREGCSITFEARSSVHPIRVETAEITGGLEAEVEGGQVRVLPGARLEVPMDGLRSGNPLVDRETRRRLDLRHDHRLVAELIDARPVGDGLLACRGEVTFQGRSQEVEGELHVGDQDDGTLRLSGGRVVDVRRWGLQPPRLLVLKVAPEVRVHLQLRARPAEDVA
jgi:hypothetical protein